MKYKVLKEFLEPDTSYWTQGADYSFHSNDIDKDFIERLIKFGFIKPIEETESFKEIEELTQEQMWIQSPNGIVNQTFIDKLNAIIKQVNKLSKERK